MYSLTHKQIYKSAIIIKLFRASDDYGRQMIDKCSCVDTKFALDVHTYPFNYIQLIPFLGLELQR